MQFKCLLNALRNSALKNHLKTIIYIIFVRAVPALEIKVAFTDDIPWSFCGDGDRQTNNSRQRLTGFVTLSRGRFGQPRA
jgi:hypothetical protein